MPFASLRLQTLPPTTPRTRAHGALLWGGRRHPDIIHSDLIHSVCMRAIDQAWCITVSPSATDHYGRWYPSPVLSTFLDTRNAFGSHAAHLRILTLLRGGTTIHRCITTTTSTRGRERHRPILHFAQWCREWWRILGAYSPELSAAVRTFGEVSQWCHTSSSSPRPCGGVLSENRMGKQQETK